MFPWAAKHGPVRPPAQSMHSEPVKLALPPLPSTTPSCRWSRPSSACGQPRDDLLAHSRHRAAARARRARSGDSRRPASQSRRPEARPTARRSQRRGTSTAWLRPTGPLRGRRRRSSRWRRLTVGQLRQVELAAAHACRRGRARRRPRAGRALPSLPRRTRARTTTRGPARGPALRAASSSTSSSTSASPSSSSPSTAISGTAGRWRRTSARLKTVVVSPGCELDDRRRPAPAAAARRACRRAAGRCRSGTGCSARRPAARARLRPRAGPS